MLRKVPDQNRLFGKLNVVYAGHGHPLRLLDVSRIGLIRNDILKDDCRIQNGICFAAVAGEEETFPSFILRFLPQPVRGAAGLKGKCKDSIGCYQKKEPCHKKGCQIPGLSQCDILHLQDLSLK